jgi:hypothetical protein
VVWLRLSTDVSHNESIRENRSRAGGYPILELDGSVVDRQTLLAHRCRAWACGRRNRGEPDLVIRGCWLLLAWRRYLDLPLSYCDTSFTVTGDLVKLPSKQPP